MKLIDTGKVKIGQLYQPRLSAEEAGAGRHYHKKDYTWLWLILWFIACVWGTTIFITWLERKDTTIDQKQLDCLSRRGQGAAVIFDDKGTVVDCKRRR